MSILYTVAYRDGGDPTAATGLTPTWNTFDNAADGTDLSGDAPAIVEIGGGHYRFTMDWDAVAFTGVDSITFVLDGGVGIADPGERYVTGRIDRWDEDAKIAADVAFGKWEVVSDQLKVYDRAGNVIRTFDLFDAGGSPTSTFPAKREVV